jgi:GH24 family phage-related lysozyme (muramidase)
LQELLQRGFPDEMIKVIDQGLLKDGTHILDTNDEVRVTINVANVKGTSGIATLQSINFIEISDKIVSRKEDVEKIDLLAKDLEKIFPHIDFSVVSSWTTDLQKKEAVEEMKGVFLEKNNWTLSEKMVDFVRGLEGKVYLKPFWDTKHWGIGYGHMMKSQFEEGQEITKERAEELYRKDLASCEASVKRAINVPMTLDMYAACVAFSYNGGNKGFATSETASLINQKKYKEAFERWKTEKINLGTKTEKGLRKRREKESALFMSNIQNNIT